VLGFLSVSTFDARTNSYSVAGFNPVLGFLSVSTIIPCDNTGGGVEFQSRAGFSECLDAGADRQPGYNHSLFQSRAGFSECLDLRR